MYPSSMPGPGRAAPVSLMQSRVWARAARDLGQRVVPLTSLGLTGQASIRRLPGLGSLAMVAGVPLGPDMRALRDLRRRLGAWHLVVVPTGPRDSALCSGAGLRPIAPPRQTAGLAIARDPIEQIRGLSVPWCRSLRHAMRQQITVARVVGAAQLAEGMDGPTHRPAALSPAAIASLCAATPGTGQRFVATRGGTPLASLLILRHGASATLAAHWTSAQGHAASALHLCLSRAMLDLREMGVCRLDLGNIDWREDPALARFKTGTGAEVETTGGRWLDSAWLPRRRSGAAFATPVSLASGPALTLR
jgi:hypothetical protein